MNNFFVLDLGKGQRNGYIIGSRLPTTDPAYSPYLDIGYNRQDYGWRDEQPHLHTHSEEYFIVLRGGLELLVHDQPVAAEPYHLTGVQANVPHQINAVRTPVENFLIRVPGGQADKISLDPTGSQPETRTGLVSIDLQKPHDDYLLGACLPPEHPHYSPHLDFTCVWGVDPQKEWKSEKLHFHNLREEYYIILRGALNFSLGNERITVSAGQILGVKPPIPHQVIGGEGPVDILFVRVPGGRGDKILCSAE